MKGQDKAERILLFLTTLSGIAVCFFLQPAAGIAAAVTFLICACILEGFRKKRRDHVHCLCEETAGILRGAEQISFAAFQEGELSILASEIRKMTVRLREQNAALHKDKKFMKEALEDISHQLRTPLTSMMLLLEMLRKPDLSRTQQTEYIQELYSLLTRMQWLIETLLSLSRLDAGAVRMQQQEIRCSELITKALEPLMVSLDLKNIRTDIHIDEDAVLTGDLSYLTEAVGNILKNCLEHTPDDGCITVTASENAIYTGILISDSGNGIAAEDLPHVFERFYRGSAFSKNGYGIGLAYANKIVTELNGSLQVRNAVPHGAEFDIRIYKTVV